jgi:hypothetical protein
MMASSFFPTTQVIVVNGLGAFFSGTAGFFAQTAVFQFFQFLYTVQAML